MVYLYIAMILHALTLLTIYYRISKLEKTVKELDEVLTTTMEEL